LEYKRFTNKATHLRKKRELRRVRDRNVGSLKSRGDTREQRRGANESYEREGRGNGNIEKVVGPKQERPNVGRGGYDGGVHHPI